MGNGWFLPAGPGPGIHVSNPGIWHRVYWDNFSGCPVSVREEPFIMSLDDGVAVHEAIELLKKKQEGGDA